MLHLLYLNNLNPLALSLDGLEALELQVVEEKKCINVGIRSQRMNRDLFTPSDQVAA